MLVLRGRSEPRATFSRRRPLGNTGNRVACHACKGARKDILYRIFLAGFCVLVNNDKSAWKEVRFPHSAENKK